MTRFDIYGVMASLAERRPLFHSEADFKFALAWQIKEALPGCEVRLECKPLPAERTYLDICLPTEGVAIELKYPVYYLRQELNGEAFDLKESARDNIRYDYVKDIQRLERLAREDKRFARGLAIMLTNAPRLWDDPIHDNNDRAFLLHEGRTLTGEMAWARPRPEKDKERQGPLTLDNVYNLQWRDYSDLLIKYGKFRYLAVEVG